MIENDTLKAFAFDIQLPDETSPRFYIFHDLAELFGEEFNRDALKRLRKLLRGHPQNPRGKLISDYEADCVSLNASKADVIYLVARIINEESISAYRRECSEEEYAEILAELQGWKRRKPKKWQVGDVFSFSLSNGDLGFGQVLAREYGAPTCALLDIRSSELISVSEIEKARVISILHLGSDLLDKGGWQVIGTARVLADPDSSQHGSLFDVGSTSFGSGQHLQDLAEAFYSLSPWNVGYCGDDEYFDKQLMADVKRPENCLWLNDEKRRAYRDEHGITA
ncbi:Imm26 family immunity protein [Persicirhabdus sediminis]|uniref:Uncharacterized protein n=1 Tax=Persicirhabdus sediminis TaxID=454144 RepID=A0A8J7MAR2_9BACT|nr:Imm26 family immunity protein [Persicirhabdus sediminis]MBK1789593.1 hypothetical protein [Persicirhabdus sediminis]